MLLICTRTCSTCQKAVSLLRSRGIEYQYRDYRVDPLTAAELEKLVSQLGVPAHQLLRKNDPAYRTLGLSGTESDQKIIRYLVRHPTLLIRPIGIVGKRAMVGRPPERLLELLREA